MNTYRTILKTLLAVVFTMAVASMAQAQATRTWVSGVGDDVNPCSRTAPCKTFAGAISKTATGGEIDCIDPGGFGAVTITKSITIDGGGTFASILSAGTTGIIINAPTNSTVTIRNLSINGAGTGIFGIRMIAGGTLSVENCYIFNMTSHGIQVNLANGALANLYVKDTNIATGNTTVSRGINIEPVSGSAGVVASIDNVRLERMSVGFFAGAGSVASIRNSVVVSNTVAGIQATAVGGNSQVTISNCLVSHNGAGVQSGSGPVIIRITNSTVNNNSNKGLLLSGGTIVSSGNNSVFGNAADDAPTSTPPQI